MDLNADIETLKGLVQRREFDQARQKAETLLTAHPTHAPLFNILGIVALSTGQENEAKAHFQKALSFAPDFTGAAANLGVVLMRQKQFDDAIAVLENAAKTDPGSLQVKANLANAYLNARRNQDAFDQSTELLKHVPDNLDFLKMRATAALGTGAWHKAEEAINRIEAVASETNWSMEHRFDVLSKSGRTEEAVSFGLACVEAAPTLATPLADLMVELGRFEEARQLLRQAVDVNSDDALAYFHYGKSRRWTDDDPMFERLRAAASRFTQTGRSEGAFVFFAWAKANMDLGRHEDVFPTLLKANDLQGRGMRYDLDGQRAQVQNVRETWTAEAIASSSASGDDSVAPIFIVGMPRSGSTLTEHVVEAHPAITSTGEGSLVAKFFPVKMPADEAAVSEASQKGVKVLQRAAGPEGRLLDKFLYNYQRLGSLAAAFPKAKFIQTQRDPRAIALSIYSNPLDVAQHPYSANLADLAGFCVQYLELMEHWKAVLGDRLIVSDYETLVEDPEPHIRDLIARLDLPWDDACLKPEAVQKRVKTLSVVQVRSGINTASVERWRPYESDLAPFTERVSAVWDFDGGRPRNRT